MQKTNGKLLLKIYLSDESEDEVEIVEVQIEQEPIPPNDITDDEVDTDTDIPEVKIEVEASHSHKVPLETRTNVFNVLRKSLHRIFPLDAAAACNTAWKILEGAPTSMEDRTLVLAEAAKKLEYAIHIMCATPSGYELHVAQKRRAIVSLDVDTGKRRTKNSEKNRVYSAEDEDEDEDEREVMDALRGGVECSHEMHKGHYDPGVIDVSQDTIEG